MKQCKAVMLFFLTCWSFGQANDKELVSATGNELFAAITELDADGIRPSFTDKAVLETINK